MLKKYRQYCLRKRMQQFLKKRDFSQRNSPLVTLGVILDEALTEDLELFTEFGLLLGLQPKNIKQLTFSETTKRIPTLRQNQITNKEFNIHGEIGNEYAKDFLKKPFDVLIGFYQDNHRYLNALMAESAAKFKIGFNDAAIELYDLIIAADLRDRDMVKTEIVKYLQVMNKI